ncbi:hypothetical protein Dimus_023840 [Dionaea muscipula]
MHGWEGGEKYRKRCRHMWVVSSTTTTTSIAAVASDSPSANSFVKDVRKINIGDCALFKPPHDSPPFIGIIRSLASDKECNLKLLVNWLYRPAEVKLGKGVALEAAPNEVFYSFHRDEIPAASLLHPCKVAFLPKGVELPSGVSSCVCRRVYDITNKCLWWLTDRDYINDRQEEVNQLLRKTRLEMHATVQQQQQHGGRSPKPMNGPTSTSQLKNSPETMQTCTGSFPSQSKGKKRERSDQASEPLKRERASRTDDGDVGNLKFDSLLKSEIARITERGGLVNFEGVERLVQLMQTEKPERNIDWSSRSLLAGVIAATDRFDCLSRFVQLRGLVVLDEWLQEVHKGKVGDSSIPKDSDRSVEECLLVLLRALDKLPVNLHALQTCNIGKSVNHLRSHRNSEVQKKAKSLVDTWKKRVEAEMNISDAKSGSCQQAPWTARSRPEVSHGGNRQTSGSSDAVMRSSLAQLSSSKSASVKIVQLESNGKSSPASPGSLKAPLPASPNANFKDGQPRVSVSGVNPELPQIAARDEKSSSSSHSHTNSQCSSEHGKNLVASAKEDARSSTAGSTSISKIIGSASRYRRSPNGLHGTSLCVGQREGGSSRNSAATKISASEKLTESPLTCEKTCDAPFSEANNHKLIVKIPNRGRSPAQSNVGGSVEDPIFTSSRASSPVHSEKHDQSGHILKDNIDAYRTIITSDMNTESWQSNDLKDVGSDEGDGSPTMAPDCDRCQTADDPSKPADVLRPASMSSANQIIPRKLLDSSFSSMNALIESCVKYSEASENAMVRDDIGMNLLASVAAGEISKSGIATPTDSPLNMAEEACTDYNGNDEQVQGTSQVNEVNPCSHSSTSGKDLTQNMDSCLRSNGKSDDLVGPASPQTAEKTAGSEVLHEKKGSLHDELRDYVLARQNMSISMAPESKDSPPPKEGRQKIAAEPLSECLLTKADDEKKNVNQGANSNALMGQWRSESLSCPEKVVKNEEVSATYSVGKGSPPESLNNLKVDHTITNSADAQTHVDKQGNLSCDEENVTSGISQKLDGSDMGSAVPERKNTGYLENLSSKEALGHGPSRLSSQDSKVLTIEKEPSTTLNSPKLEAVEGTVLEERISTPAAAPILSRSSDTDGKLEFDLNEGLNVDDGKCVEPVNWAPPGFSASIFLGPVPSSVTVAAAAKGSFVPPEDLLRNKGELGWKGSAATSAFRPAEPRKVGEIPLGTGGVPLFDAAGSKQARPLLEFDLNVADDRILEDMGCQSSTPGKLDTKSSRFLVGGQAAASLRCSGGLDLDLNRVDEVPEFCYHQSNVHRYEPLLPLAKPSSSSSRLSINEASTKRNFDLNNGPAADEAVAEPSLYNQARSNFPMQPPPVRMNNNIDIGSLSSWYPPGSSYSPVPIPSLLPDRGEPLFPVVGATGGPHPHRILSGGATGSTSTPFNPDAYRGPVLPPAAAMPFPSTPFQYPVFPFGTTFPLPSSSTFSGGSAAAYMDLSSGGRLCIPAVSSQYPRPYVVTFPDISNNNSGVDSGGRKFGRQGLDLNAGPGGVLPDAEGRDETVPVPMPILSRQVAASNSITFAEEQARMMYHHHHHLPSSVLKRKEPEGGGGWDGDRLSFKQASWK